MGGGLKQSLHNRTKVNQRTYSLSIVSHTLQNGSLKKITARHTFIASENLSVFGNLAVSKCQKTKTQSSLISKIYVTSWSNRKIQWRS
jgi:hypothetical protein